MAKTDLPCLEEEVKVLGAYNIEFDKENYFAYIGVFSDSGYKYKSLILDTNVVINLEKFYYSPHKMDERKRNAVVEFLLKNRKIDKVPGLGEYEACWDATKLLTNQGQLQKIQNAYNKLSKWNKKEIINHSKGEGVKYEIMPYRTVEKPETLLSGDILDIHITSTYACLLKFRILSKMKKKGKELDLFREYIRFMKKEIKLLHAIEINLAYDYFLGSSTESEYVQKIMKFNSKNELLSTWNASWDIYFLRILHQSYSSGWFNIIKPKLVTSDEGLIGLCRYCTLIGGIDTEKSVLSMISFNRKNINPKYEDQANRILQSSFNSSTERIDEFKKIEDPNSYMIEIAMKIEKELLDLKI